MKHIAISIAIVLILLLVSCNSSGGNAVDSETNDISILSVEQLEVLYDDAYSKTYGEDSGAKDTVNRKIDIDYAGTVYSINSNSVIMRTGYGSDSYTYCGTTEYSGAADLTTSDHYISGKAYRNNGRLKFSLPMTPDEFSVAERNCLEPQLPGFAEFNSVTATETNGIITIKLSGLPSESVFVSRSYQLSGMYLINNMVFEKSDAATVTLSFHRNGALISRVTDLTATYLSDGNPIQATLTSTVTVGELAEDITLPSNASEYSTVTDFDIISEINRYTDFYLSLFDAKINTETDITLTVGRDSKTIGITESLSYKYTDDDFVFESDKASTDGDPSSAVNYFYEEGILSITDSEGKITTQLYPYSEALTYVSDRIFMSVFSPDYMNSVSSAVTADNVIEVTYDLISDENSVYQNIYYGLSEFGFDNDDIYAISDAVVRKCYGVLRFNNDCTVFSVNFIFDADFKLGDGTDCNISFTLTDNLVDTTSTFMG